MKVVTWNVNSVRKREPLIIDFLKKYQPDVLCLQEIKCQDEQFLYDQFLDAGYNQYVSGQKAYNGVAILTKIRCELISKKLVGYEFEEARFIKILHQDICIYNVYVPNGQQYGSPAYYKQKNFITLLSADITETKKTLNKIVVCGDYNIAPLDDHADFALRSSFICDTDLRKLWFDMLKIGLIDSSPDKYTWWDYRYKGIGARIDAILHTDALKCTESIICDNYRFDIESPSDHTPVLSVFSVE